MKSGNTANLDSSDLGIISDTSVGHTCGCHFRACHI
jgi:hypothetical protein